METMNETNTVADAVPAETTTVPDGTTTVPDGTTEAPKARKPRGFAALKLRDPDMVKRIASLGGRVAHSAGSAHEWTSDEARAAGKIGGAVSGARASARKAAREAEKNKNAA